MFPFTRLRRVSFLLPFAREYRGRETTLTNKLKQTNKQKCRWAELWRLWWPCCIFPLVFRVCVAEGRNLIILSSGLSHKFTSTFLGRTTEMPERTLLFARAFVTLRSSLPCSSHVPNANQMYWRATWGVLIRTVLLPQMSSNFSLKISLSI